MLLVYNTYTPVSGAGVMALGFRLLIENQGT